MEQVKYYWLGLRGKQAKGSVMLETILVIVVLIALVVIFKSQMTGVVEKIFEKITKEATKI